MKISYCKNSTRVFITQLTEEDLEELKQIPHDHATKMIYVEGKVAQVSFKTQELYNWYLLKWL